MAAAGGSAAESWRNHIRKPTRPEWIAHQDFTPIEPCADDALAQFARRYRQAAE